MKKHILKFETPDDWRPLEPACWAGCPFSCLTKLGNECNAHRAYERDNLMICPVVRFSGEFQWSQKGMTFKEAARFINPDTCVEAMEEYRRQGDDCAIKAMREACELACKALKFMDDYNTE